MAERINFLQAAKDALYFGGTLKQYATPLLNHILTRYKPAEDEVVLSGINP